MIDHDGINQGTKPFNTKAVSKKSIIIKGIGLVAGIALIYWFFSKANLNEIWIQVSSIGFKFILLVFVMFFGFYIDTLGWKLCYPVKLLHVSTLQLFLIRLAGESLAQINPTNVIAGDTMKAVILKRKGVDYTQSIVSLTVYRFITILAAATFIIAGIIAFFDYIGLLADKKIVIGIIILFTVLNLFIFYRLNTSKGIFIPVYKILSSMPVISKGISQSYDKFNEIDKELSKFFQNKKINFLLAYIYSIIHRLPEVVEYYIIFTFLGISTTLFSCLAVSVGVTVFRALGTFIPGQLGIEEYGNKVMLNFISIPGASTWLSVSILRRARQLAWILLGVCAFFIVMKNDGKKEKIDSVKSC